MLLKSLSRPEQELFLELCDFAANIDNDFSKKEQEYIQEYRQEMFLSENDYVIKGLGYDAILEKLIEISSPANIRRILIELIALLKADQIIHPQENELISKLKEDFSISSAQINEINELLELLNNVYARIFAIVDAN